MTTLLDSTLRREAQLLRFGTYLKDEYIKPTFQELSKELPKMLTGFDELNKSERTKLAREVRNYVSVQMSGMFDDITGELHLLADDEASFMLDLYDDYTTEVMKAVTASAVVSTADNALISLESSGVARTGVWSDFVKDNINTTTRMIDGAVLKGFRDGETLQSITQTLRGSYNRGTKQYTGGILNGRATQHAETLARTGISHYANQARDKFANLNNDLLGESVFFATLDNRTTTTCFVPETEVCPLGDIDNVIRSDYTGYAVTIRTASGKELTGTPNHPILTTDGFVPMGELDPAKHIVYTPLVDNFEIVGLQDVCVPTQIGKLFDSVNHPAIFDVTTKSSTTADFYGDGMGGDSKVDILHTNGHLSYDIVPSRLKHSLYSKLALIGDDSPFNPCGLLDSLLSAGRPVAKTSKVTTSFLEIGIKEVFGSVEDFDNFRRSFSAVKELNSSEPVSFDAGVSLTSFESDREYTSLFKELGYSGCSNPIFLAELGGTSPVPVLMDNIVMVERKFINSHVYTLSTKSTLYIAGGIIVKNCLGFHAKRWKSNDPSKPVLPLHYNERSVFLHAGLGIDPLEGDRPLIGGKHSKEAREEFELRQSRTDGKVKYRGRKDLDVFEVEQVSAKLTSQEWLKRQPRFFVESTLGKTRAQLFLDGNLPIEKFTDLGGKPLTLAELRKTAAGEKAFRKAGLD